MKSILKYSFIAVLGILLLSFTNAHRGGRDWDFLGSRTVNFSLDKDVLEVGAKDGAFTKLLFKVDKGSLNMHKIVVSYGNGSRDEINVKHEFKRGTTSRVVDLKGKGRIVKRITFWYDTKNRSARKATMKVYGRHLTF